MYLIILLFESNLAGEFLLGFYFMYLSRSQIIFICLNLALNLHSFRYFFCEANTGNSKKEIIVYINVVIPDLHTNATCFSVFIVIKVHSNYS